MCFDSKKNCDRLRRTHEQTNNVYRRRGVWGPGCRKSTDDLFHVRDRSHDLSLLGPALLGIDLEAACKRYEEKHGGKKETDRTAWRQLALRAFRAREGAQAKTVQQAEALLPEQRVRIRRGGQIMDATGRC